MWKGGPSLQSRRTEKLRSEGTVCKVYLGGSKEARLTTAQAENKGTGDDVGKVEWARLPSVLNSKPLNTRLPSP